MMEGENRLSKQVENKGIKLKKVKEEWLQEQSKGRDIRAGDRTKIDAARAVSLAKQWRAKESLT